MHPIIKTTSIKDSAFLSCVYMRDYNLLHQQHLILQK